MGCSLFVLFCLVWFACLLLLFGSFCITLFVLFCDVFEVVVFGGVLLFLEFDVVLFVIIVYVVVSAVCFVICLLTCLIFCCC